MLDELAPHLAGKKLHDLESRLSKGDVPSEWEIAVGFALSKVGKIVSLSEDHRNPDYIFAPAGTAQEIQIEVTTLSDQSADDENPVDLFLERMWAAIRKAGIDHKIGSFSWSLGDREEGGKIFIGVPEKRFIDAFFKSPEFLAFLNGIKQAPAHPHQFDFAARGSNSVIAFAPGSNRYASGRHRSFRVARNLKDATVFNGLRKKEDQLKKAGIDLPAIVFLCDNDNHLLKHDQLNAPGCYKIDQVVSVFLNGRQHQQAGPWIIQQGMPKKGKRIDAVATLTVHHPYNFMTGFNGSKREFRGKLLPADHCNAFVKSGKFLQMINTAISYLPVPVSTPSNAKRKYKLPAFYGGGKMTSGANSLSVSLSLLTLQKLLTGDISYDDFYRDHKDLIDQIRRVTASGQMISRIDVEAQKDQDDDWATMRFDGFQPEFLFKVNKAS